jgi:predicted DNA-binding protein (MmcQ/YjbR family)
MAKKPKSGDPLDAAAKELLAYAHSLPGAWEDHPWPGETVAKVGKKVFVFSGWQVARDARPGRKAPDQVWGISVKLVQSHAEARSLPFTEPTGYGLGKAGWVSAKFSAGETPMLNLLKSWIRESYLQVAPKKLAAQLDAAPAPTPKKKAAAKKAPAKKPAAKKKAASMKKPSSRGA